MTWKHSQPLLQAGEQAVLGGAGILILSDRLPDGWAAMPDLWPAPACTTTDPARSSHQCQPGLDSGEPREVHHFALLVGFGLSRAIHPYLALERSCPGSPSVSAGSGRSVRRQQLSQGMLLWGGSRFCPKWVSRPCKVTRAPRSSRRSGSAPTDDRYFCVTPFPHRRIGLDRDRADVNTFRQAAVVPTGPIPVDSGGQYRWRSSGRGTPVQSAVVHAAASGGMR